MSPWMLASLETGASVSFRRYSGKLAAKHQVTSGSWELVAPLAGSYTTTTTTAIGN